MSWDVEACYPQDLTMERRLRGKDETITELLEALEYASNDVYRSDDNDGEFTISNEAVARIRKAIGGSRR